MFHYWNPKLLNLEIQRCGYTFSASSYVKYLLAVYLGIAGFAYLFQLQIFFSVIVMAAASIFVPTVFLMNYKNLYEEKKFEDLHGKEISARAVDADGRELPVSVIKLIAPDGSQLEKELNPEAFWTAQRGVYEITYQAEENYQGAYIRKVTKVCRVTVD